MRRELQCVLWGFVVCVCIGAARERADAGGPSFALSLNAPASVEGAPGGSVQVAVTGRLASSGIGSADGCQGWSVSIGTEGWVPVSATTSGTAGACSNMGGLRDCSGGDSSFEKTEIVNPTDNGGQNGVVSTVALSFSQLVSLPPSGTQDIVRLTLMGTVPAPAGDECEPRVCRVFYVNGLIGSGEPVVNTASYHNTSFDPSLGQASTNVCPIFLRPTNLIVEVEGATAGPKAGNVAPWVFEVDAPVAGVQSVNANIVLDAKIEPCTSNPQECVGENFTVPDPEDPTVILSYGCSDMMDNDGDGASDAEDVDCRSVQGFSFSVATDNCFGINRATTRGTVSDLNTRPPGIRDPEGSFEKTEVIDPANNGGQQGAVCAVVFSFTRPIFLAQDSRNIVAILRGDVDRTGASAPGVCTPPCLIRVLDASEEGLSGSGEPVKTAVTVGGDTEIPGLCNATIQFCGRVAPPPQEFIRCDANDDGRNDIADAVWIVNDLLNRGPETLCPDAGDCNDDGLGPDVSDAVYGIEYQFMGGARPPQPYPACGEDPTADTIPDCMPTQNCPLGP